MKRKTRICRTCKKVLPENVQNFQKNKQNKCGWYTSCIGCRTPIDFMRAWGEVWPGVYACNYGRTYTIKF